MNALISAHAMSFPHATSQQREGATHVATLKKTGAKVFELGRDPFVAKDVRILSRLRTRIIPFKRSGVHNIVDLAISKIIDAKKSNTLISHCVYLAVNHNNELVAILRGEAAKSSHLHEIASFQQGVGSPLISFFYREGSQGQVSVHKGADSLCRRYFTNNSWHRYPFSLTEFYRNMGFDNVSPEEMPCLSCSFSQIQAWCEKKLASVRLVHNAQPQALVISGLGDGNTRTP